MSAPVRPPKPKLSYPRPQLVHDHAVLFREAAYDDGRLYGEPDPEDDEGDA